MQFFLKNTLKQKYIQFIVERVDGEYGDGFYPIVTVYLKDMTIKT